mmetsp:Transcript_10480/g.28979  ORF Transcript_10480/g.28979 Transcript_10480/m.28979 type:complete len:83 (+) Transcript_10480:565-813(+)
MKRLWNTLNTWKMKWQINRSHTKLPWNNNNMLHTNPPNIDEFRPCSKQKCASYFNFLRRHFAAGRFDRIFFVVELLCHQEFV